MSKTQRTAWLTLGISILLLAFGAIIFTSMFTPGDRTAGTRLVKVWIWVILAFLAGGTAFVHFKRTFSKVDCDERDNYIKKNAMLVSFVSLWFLLVAASLIPAFAVGDDGSIPVCLLPIINFGVFLIVLAVHSVAVLLQYGWTNRGKNHE
jgi:uncharacterized membrane-anchored protein